MIYVCLLLYFLQVMIIWSLLAIYLSSSLSLTTYSYSGNLAYSRTCDHYTRLLIILYSLNTLDERCWYLNTTRNHATIHLRRSICDWFEVCVSYSQNNIDECVRSKGIFGEMEKELHRKAYVKYCYLMVLYLRAFHV